LRDIVYALGVAWTLVKERRNCEVVYFLMSGLHLAAGLPVARALGKPIVMKFAGSGNVVGLRATWLGRLELTFLRRWASQILILNPGMADEALEVGFDKSRIGWMPNPVDTDHFSPCSLEMRARLRRELGVRLDISLILFVGRLAPQKELPWLIGAFTRVIRKRPNSQLVLIGDGPLRVELVQLVSTLSLEGQVIFTGRLDNDDVLKWLQIGDVFTLISAAEGLPCSLIEAMSVGIPPLVSDIPAHRQLVVNDTSGLLTKVGDEDAIASGLVRLLNDPPARKRIGTAARQQIVENFSTGRVGDCYEDLLADCASTGD
jgi:glycosyltransferase involved in cell wall biosynthesis